MGDEDDLYGILGACKSSTPEEIKRLYKQLALKHHPDKNPGNAEAHDVFKRISFAYSVLSDPSKRKTYDVTGSTEEMDISSEDFAGTFQDLFTELFGGFDIKDMLRCFSKRELAKMPPFPLPKKLFPRGTFPAGMRFSNKLSKLPPSIEQLLMGDDPDALAELLGGMGGFGMNGGARGVGRGGFGRGGDDDDSDWEEFDGSDGSSWETASGEGKEDEGEDDDEEGYDDEEETSEGSEDGGSGGAASSSKLRLPQTAAGGAVTADDVTETAGGDVRLNHSDTVGMHQNAGARGRSTSFSSQQQQQQHGGNQGTSIQPPGDTSAGVGSAPRAPCESTQSGPDVVGCGKAVQATRSGSTPELPTSGTSRSPTQPTETGPSASGPPTTADSQQRAAVTAGGTAAPGDGAASFGATASGATAGVPPPPVAPAPPPPAAPRPAAAASRASLDPALVRDWIAAARVCDLSVMEMLLSRERQLLWCRGTGLGHTALHWCAAKGNVTAVAWLLGMDAGVNALNDAGATPLHAAARNGQVDVVKVLLAEPGVQAELVDDDGATPAALAAQFGHSQVGQAITQYLRTCSGSAAAAPSPYDSTSRTTGGLKAPSSAAPSPTLTTTSNLKAASAPAASTPLGGAASRPPGVSEASSNLGKPAGCIPNGGSSSREPASAASAQAAVPGPSAQQQQQRDAGRTSPSHSPAALSRSNSCKESAPGASHKSHSSGLPSRSSDAPPPGGANNGSSVEEMSGDAASSSLSSAVVLTTKHRGGKVLTSEERAKRRAALIAADEAADREEERQEALRDKAAVAMATACGVRREEGRDWMDAAKRGSVSDLRRLLARNARLLGYQGQGTNNGFCGHSALHWAAAKGHPDALRWLLGKGAAVDLRNNSGATALHAAVGNERSECVKLLVLEGGADAQVADDDGESPRDMAVRRNLSSLAHQIDVYRTASAVRSTPRADWSARQMRTLLTLAGTPGVAGMVEKAELLQAVDTVLAKLPARIVASNSKRPSPTVSAVGETGVSGTGGTGSAEGSHSSASRPTTAAAAAHNGTGGASAAAAGGRSSERPPSPRSSRSPRESHADESSRPASAQHRAEGNGKSSVGEAAGVLEGGAANGDGGEGVSAAVEGAKAKGNAAFAGADFAKAVSHYGMAIRLAPTPSAVLHSNRAAAFAGLKYWGKSLDDADKAAELQPEWAKAHARRGTALLAMRQWPEAAQAFSRALELEPGYSAARQGLQQAQDQKADS